MFPVILFGLNNPHTTSADLGMAMFNLEREKFLVLTAMAAPPPLFVPGRGVLIYFMPDISNIFSIFSWCFLFSCFCQTSVRKEISPSLSNMSSEKFWILENRLLMLKFRTLGKVKAWIDLLSLFKIFLIGCNLETWLFSGLLPQKEGIGYSTVTLCEMFWVILEFKEILPSNCSILSWQGGSWVGGVDPPFKSFPEVRQTKHHICCNCCKIGDLLPVSDHEW